MITSKMGGVFGVIVILLLLYDARVNGDSSIIGVSASIPFWIVQAVRA
jgi:hypothetical protein